MMILKKKICMLGAFGVGKSSLVRQFVNQQFSEKYQSTLGVKIDKKEIQLGEHHVQLMLWDLAGEEQARPVRMSYLRGSAAALIVVDSTRPDTLDVAIGIKDRMQTEIGDLCVTFLVNKCDLGESSRLTDQRLEELRLSGHDFVRTSAKTGANVELAFTQLAASICEPDAMPRQCSGGPGSLARASGLH